MVQSDKGAWIVKRFDGESTQTIENYYTTNLDRGVTPTNPLINSTTTTNKYTSLLEKTQSTFSIQAFYKDTFAPTHYDIESDSFIVDDVAAFSTNLNQEFNSDTNTIQDKVLLAQILQTQGSGLNIDKKEILNAVSNPITKTLIKETIYNRDVLLGTDDKKHKILLAKGDDALQSGTGIDTFYFRRGDDTLQGGSGDDVLQTSNDKNKILQNDRYRRCVTLDVTQIRYNNVVYKNERINIVNDLNFNEREVV